MEDLTIDSALLELADMFPSENYNFILECHQEGIVRFRLWVYGRVACETPCYSWSGLLPDVMRDIEKWKAGNETQTVHSM